MAQHASIGEFFMRENTGTYVWNDCRAFSSIITLDPKQKYPKSSINCESESSDVPYEDIIKVLRDHFQSETVTYFSKF